MVLPQKSNSWLTAPAMLVLAGFACTQSSAAPAVLPEFEGGGVAIMRPPAGGGFTAMNVNPHRAEKASEN